MAFWRGALYGGLVVVAAMGALVPEMLHWHSPITLWTALAAVQVIAARDK